MLSIIMPVYNTADYLEETVKSVLAQTYRDFELILVDDGSTDGSGELCDQLAAQDVRIRVIHKENGGVASARNVGLNAVRGDYIGWVDSDDLISPIMFEVMLKLAKRHDADIVQCSHVRQPEELATERPAEEEPVEILDAVGSLKRIYRSHYTNALALWSKVYRSELFEGLRFTEGTAFEDDEVVPQVLERGQKAVFMELPLYCYMLRESSIVTSPKVANIMALTCHLENRMLRFKELDQELYALGRDHFFHYLKIKTCDKVSGDNPIQKQAIQMLKKHRKLFFEGTIFYDRVALHLLYWPGGSKWVAKSEFAPIQSIFAKVKKLFGK